MGSAMLAICTMLSAVRLLDRFAAAWYYKIDQSLEAGIERAWASTHAARFSSVPFSRASHNVWDLLLNGANAQLLAQMLATVPLDLFS